MNKKRWIIFFIIISFFVGTLIYYYFNNKNSNNENNYEAKRTSTENQTEENKTNKKDNEQKQPQYKEEQVATFSTKIYSNDYARQNNIKISCNTLNGTTVNNGATFSFTNTVGQATTAKGYQKADIFDNKGRMKKGLGGGNCQISSTLYNAVLATPGLVVTERHAHSNYVPYIQKGKDAAVAFGSYDFKFRNDSGNTIKINASTDENTITTTLIAIKQV